MNNKYHVLAFYHFVKIDDPQAEVDLHKEFFQGRDITSRIYISEEGINGQMSASEKDSEEYRHWMHSRPAFQSVHFKIHLHHEHAFPRQTVKLRKHLVAHDRPIDLSKRGEHVTPEKWKQMMQEREKYLILDVRNDYEWKLGRFDGASLPPCETFREFEVYADALKEEKNPEQTPVMMYCTGGIRCEFYSSILKEKGFTNVFQLEGGIINYGLEEGVDHWLGKLFVFDDRLSIPISDEDTQPIASCHHCETLCDTYCNCANMDCNQLFLCCPTCLHKFEGCCDTECLSSEKLRPYDPLNPNKPFRRKHNYKK